MTSTRSSSLIALALNDGLPPSENFPFWRLLVLSLTLHFGILLVAELVRLLPSHEERIIAHEISLVNLPSSPQRKKTRATPKKRVATPKVAPTPKPKVQPKPKVKVAPPVKQSIPAPPPVAKVAPPPRPAPKPIPLPDLARNPSADQAQARATQRMNNVLGGIELPPNAPEFGDLGARPLGQSTPRASLPNSPVAPQPSPIDPLAPTQLPQDTPVKPRRRSDKFQKDIDSLLNKLQVPESPVLQKPLPRRVPPKPKRKPRTSLSKGLKSELLEIERKFEQERKRREKLKPPVVQQADVPEPEAVDEAKAEVQQAELEQPTTRIQAKGGSTLADKYLSRVQQLINRQWIAPPVDLVKSMVVVVKFRLHRSGVVSDVVVEETSGNEYYDLAGRRAVLGADPLPPFPRRMSEAYLDTHFTFMVGEQTG